MIVLINGWAGLKPGLLPLEIGLRERLGREVVRVDLGLGFGCIRESAARAATQLDRIARGQRGERIDLVGYSMGGLIATYLLKFFDHGRTIRSVITLGTPHGGAPLAHFGRGLLSRVSASLAQMSPQSEFLRALATAEVPVSSRILSIAALGDGVVPARYAELPASPRQFTRVIPASSHFGLLFSRDVIDAVESWLPQPTHCLRTTHAGQPTRSAVSRAASREPGYRVRARAVAALRGARVQAGRQALEQGGTDHGRRFRDRPRGGGAVRP